MTDPEISIANEIVDKTSDVFNQTLGLMSDTHIKEVQEMAIFLQDEISKIEQQKLERIPPEEGGVVLTFLEFAHGGGARIMKLGSLRPDGKLVEARILNVSPTNFLNSKPEERIITLMHEGTHLLNMIKEVVDMDDGERQDEEQLAFETEIRVYRDLRTNGYMDVVREKLDKLATKYGDKLVAVNLANIHRNNYGNMESMVGGVTLMFRTKNAFKSQA